MKQKLFNFIVISIFLAFLVFIIVSFLINENKNQKNINKEAQEILESYKIIDKNDQKNNSVINTSDSPLIAEQESLEENDNEKPDYQEKVFSSFLAGFYFDYISAQEPYVTFSLFKKQNMPPCSVDENWQFAQVVNIDRVEWCERIQEEGAVGSSYHTYNYSRPEGENYITDYISLSYTLRFSNCGAYDEEQASACIDEHQDFWATKKYQEILNGL